MPLMKKETKNLLNANMVQLVKEIDLKIDFWNELRNREVITNTQKETIICNDRKIVTEQKTELLELLPRRGQDKFVQFCLALVATDQEHVVTDILNLNLQDINNEAAGYRHGGNNPEVKCTEKVNSQMTTNPVAANSVTSLPMDTSSASGTTDTSVLFNEPRMRGTHCLLPNKRHHESEDIVWKKLCPNGPHESEADDGIELTDSWGFTPQPINSSTDEFYHVHNNHHEVYPMYCQVRGYCLILNVSSVCNEPRLGTEVDNVQLIQLFRGLHFEVHAYGDQDGLSALEIETKVKTFFAMTCHAASNCAVLCILSHGQLGCVSGTDGGTVQLTALYKFMNDCPGLQNKPKLVFLESCSGLTYDDGNVTSTTLFSDDQTDSLHKLPYMADFFVAHPSQPGMRAHRNTKTGSWFVQAVVKVFSQFAATQSLLNLMIKVNAAVAKKESKSSDPSKAGKKQIPDQHISLRRKLYFFPGIQRTHPD